MPNFTPKTSPRFNIGETLFAIEVDKQNEKVSNINIRRFVLDTIMYTNDPHNESHYYAYGSTALEKGYRLRDLSRTLDEAVSKAKIELNAVETPLPQDIHDDDDDIEDEEGESDLDADNSVDA